MRRPLPDLTIPLWYCERPPSQFGSVSPPQGHALPGRERGTACDCDAFGPGLTYLCAAFFRLVSLLHLRFIPLKASVLIQDRVGRIANRFAIHDLFVRHFPGIRLTQIAHAFGLRINHHHVLVTVRFVLATVVQGLFCLIFRALAAPVGPIDNQSRRFLPAAFLLGKVLRRTAGQHSQLVQRLLQNRQQALNPAVRPRLTQPKHLTQQRLQRIGLLLHQAKQEFLLCRRQLSFAASTTLSFADSPSRRFVAGILSCIDSAKCLRQRLKLFVGQSRQRQQSSSVFFQSFIFKHHPIVAYFA